MAQAIGFVTKFRNKFHVVMFIGNDHYKHHHAFEHLSAAEKLRDKVLAKGKISPEYWIINPNKSIPNAVANTSRIGHK